MARKKDSNQYAMLGLLTMGAMSGYDMREFYNRSMVFFWNESYGQIYPTLKRMTAEGLVTFRHDQKEGKPARKLYSITEKGREALREWLGEPPRDKGVRSEFFLKLFLGSSTDNEVSAGHIRDWMDKSQERLEALTRIQPLLEAEAERGNREALFRLLTLDFGRRVEQTYVEWGRDSLRRLEASRTSKSP